jgi:Protein of unknown function (DUF1501)
MRLQSHQESCGRGITALHLLGIDHEGLTYKFQGRHNRLTDVHGHVEKPVLA